MAIALAALVLVPYYATGVYGLAGHYTCVPTSTLDRTTLWTPLALLNSPYNGSANVTISNDPIALREAPAGVISEGSTLHSRNGSAGGDFVLFNWTLSRATSEWVLGPGPDARCTSALSVSHTLANSSWEVDPDLVPVNATGDVGEATNISSVIAPPGLHWGSVPVNFSSVGFDNSYRPTAELQSVNTCALQGSAGYFILSGTIRSLNLTVPFAYDGGTTMPFELPAPATYSYYFAGGGYWEGNPLTPAGGGWSFQWSPCYEHVPGYSPPTGAVTS